MRGRSLRLWHRWFGVIGGPWLFLVALTGCVLVFYEEADHALNPELFTAVTQRPVTRAPIAPAIAAAERAWPGSAVNFIALPKRVDGSLHLYLVDRHDHAGAVGPGGREAFVDPHSATVQGSRVFGAWRLARANVMPFVYKLHYELHGGPWAAWLLGGLALMWVADQAIAMSLARRSAKNWREIVQLRRTTQRHKAAFDLHRAIGMWLLPVTVMMGVTGAYFNLNAEFLTILRVFSTPTPTHADRQRKLNTPLYAPPVNADAALRAARDHQPMLNPSALAYRADLGVWIVHARDPHDITWDYGARFITVEARSGVVLGSTHHAQGTAADAIMAWQYPLHSGKALGWAGRVLVLLAGMATCALTLTGYLIWWRRRTARRGARHATRRCGSPLEHSRRSCPRDCGDKRSGEPRKTTNPAADYHSLAGDC